MYRTINTIHMIRPMHRTIHEHLQYKTFCIRYDTYRKMLTTMVTSIFDNNFLL